MRASQAYGLDRDRLLTLLFYVTLVLLVLPLCFYQVYANDVWKALYSGRYLALEGHFPHHSAFTFSPVKAVVARDAFNWLGNLFFYGLHRIGGIPLLQLFRVGVVGFALGLMHGIIDFRRHPLVLVLFVAFVMSINQKLLLRNAIFAVPFTVLLMWLWFRGPLKSNRRLTWAIPGLFLFWGNVHGSYMMGVGLLGLMVAGWFADRLLRREVPVRRALRLLGVLVVVLGVVTYAKPFPDYQMWNRLTGMVKTSGGEVLSAGSEVSNRTAPSSTETAPKTPTTRSLTERASANAKTEGETAGSRNGGWYRSIRSVLHRSVFAPRPFRSGEFRFPLDQPTALFITVTLVLIPIGLGAFAVRPRRVRLSLLLPFLAASFLSLGYMRTVAYLPLVGVPVLLAKYALGDFRNVRLGPVVTGCAVVALVLFGGNLSYHLVRESTSQFVGSGFFASRWGKHPRLSDRLPEWVLRRYPNQRFFNHYNVGSWLVWKWWPHKKVFIDTKGSAYADGFLARHGTAMLPELVDRYELDYAIVPIRSSWNYVHFIPRSDWRILAFDEGMIAYARTEEAERIDPLEVFLLSAEEFRRQPPEIRQALRTVVRVVNQRQNTYVRNKNGDMVHRSRLNERPRSPGEKRQTNAASASR